MKQKKESLKGTTLKSALCWGIVYSTATAGVASVLGNNSSLFSEVFKNTILLFCLAGAVRGLLMWRVKNGFFAIRFGRRPRYS
jgi:hypothetical protein